MEEDEKRLNDVLNKIEETRRILVILASAEYFKQSGKTKEEIQEEIAKITAIFKFHLKAKHFLKGELFAEN
jgi:hypothetical protein